MVRWNYEALKKLLLANSAYDFWDRRQQPLGVASKLRRFEKERRTLSCANSVFRSDNSSLD